MTLPQWTSSPGCQIRQACAACTSIGADGDAWRRSTGRFYAMPGAGECPAGLVVPAVVDAPAPSILAVIAHGCTGLLKAATGTGGATAETIAARTAVCVVCPNAELRLGKLRVCKLCGCGTWAKVRNASESCPDGRWGKQG